LLGTCALTGRTVERLGRMRPRPLAWSLAARLPRREPPPARRPRVRAAARPLRAPAPRGSSLAKLGRLLAPRTAATSPLV